MKPVLPPVVVICVSMLFKVMFFLKVQVLLNFHFIADNSSVFQLLDQVLNLNFIDRSQKPVEVEHLLPHPVGERAHYQRRLYVFIRVEERVPLVYEPDLVENLGLLLEVKVNLDALTDLIVPEDDAVDPFVADPTLIRLICQHVPLAASWDVNLVADPALED